MICRKCGCVHEAETIGFKAACENCLTYLHSCFQCTVFDHLVERCRSLTTEAVRDTNDLNFCEEFSPNMDSPNRKEGENRTEPGKKSFESLFGKKQSS